MNPWKLTRGQRLLVNTKTGDTLVGVIRDFTRHVLFIGDVELVGRDGSRSKIDGEALIPADPDHGTIAWLQVL